MPLEQGRIEIRFLVLRTACLPEVVEFYGGALRLQPLALGKEYAIFQAGPTQLMFEQTLGTEEGQPFYHFAFEIPRNLLAEARAWLEGAKVPLLTRDGDVLVHFEDWNATSVYFHDPANNIVEFIARQNLDNDSDGPFSPEQILQVSEIGWPVVDVAEPDCNFTLPAWRDYGALKALGSEIGLILLVKEGGPWLPTGQLAARFPCRMMLADTRGSRYLSSH